MTYHEMGTDGVQIASMISGAGFFKGKNVEEGLEQTGKKIEKEASEIVDDISREAVEGLTNVFRATEEEIAEATGRIKAHRVSSGASGGGNYGYIQGNVSGNGVDNKMWRSGPALESEPHIF